MSETKRILLVCGMGMSSGFLATSARKAAKKMDKNYQIEARSETEVSSFLPSIDGLLIGPHYSQMLESFRKQAQPYHVPVEIIPESIYGMIDGKGLVEFIQNNLFKE